MARLYSAVSKGHVRVAQCWIERGARVDARDSTGRTPLHVAVGRNDIAMAAMLLEKGADADAKDNNNNAPISIASSLYKPTKMTELLIKHGAVVDVPVVLAAIILAARTGTWI